MRIVKEEEKEKKKTKTLLSLVSRRQLRDAPRNPKIIDFMYYSTVVKCVKANKNPKDPKTQKLLRSSCSSRCR